MTAGEASLKHSVTINYSLANGMIKGGSRASVNLGEHRTGISQFQGAARFMGNQVLHVVFNKILNLNCSFVTLHSLLLPTATKAANQLASLTSSNP